MSANLNSFQAYYDGTAARLKKKAAAYNRKLRKDPNPFIRMFKEDLADLSDGGKFLRGMLVSLGYRLGGGTDAETADALALAFEIFQTGVLIHDDIIDNAVMRRGKLTIQRRYRRRLEVRGTKMVSQMEAPGWVAEATALCAGDLGLYYANLEIAKAYRDNPRLGDLITYFDETVIDTIRGELLDVVLAYELQDSSYTEEERKALLEKSIGDIYRLKTARYSVIGPLHLGMMLAGAPDDQLRAVDRAADDIGVAYQIMDDILGIYADAELLGKDVGSDIAEFKQTLLYMYVCTRKPEAAERLLEYYGKPVTEESLEAVRQIFRDSGALEYARGSMNACFERAERKIARMKFLPAEDRAILRGFVEWCQGRRK